MHNKLPREGFKIGCHPPWYIRNHSLVFLTRKAHYDRNGPRTIETRQFKHFDSNKFLRDLNEMPWGNVDLYSDPNDMWREWKKMFLTCVDKHAPLKLKRVREKRCPWITGDASAKPEEEIFLKRRQSLPMIQPHGINTSVLETGQITQLSSQRNFMFLTTWKLIKEICEKREITSRNNGKTSNILEIKADNKVVAIRKT